MVVQPSLCGTWSETLKTVSIFPTCRLAIKLHCCDSWSDTQVTLYLSGEPGGLVVESLTPEREVGGLIPTPAVLCP